MFSEGLRVGAAQFCMGPRNHLAGQLQGANFTNHLQKEGIVIYVETQSARHRRRTAQPRTRASGHPGSPQF